jgi:hypothetical protein
MTKRFTIGFACPEARSSFTFLFLSGDAARWDFGAAIDAVVANAYGLTCDHYAHVLSTFSHAIYQDAPRQCLAAFDELQSLDPEAFTKKPNPCCWDIPLNENRPRPVIDLPIPRAWPAETPHRHADELFDFQITAAPSGSGILFTQQPVPRAQNGTRKG